MISYPIAQVKINDDSSLRDKNISVFPLVHKKDIEDWFVVSMVAQDVPGSEVLGEFEAGGKRYTIHRSNLHKCPRCWRYAATEAEHVCARCAEVLG